MLVVLKCHLRWNLSSKVNHKNPATDSSHLGQWLRWPEPQCGRHQQGWHHLARHGKSTQNAFYTTSKWVVSILLRNCETLCRKKHLNLILNLFESCHCELFVLVQEGGPHTEKNLGWPVIKHKASVSRCTIQPLARSFHRVKIIYTLKRNILVKTRQDLDNKLYCRGFRLTSFFWTVCLHNEQNTY